MATLFVLNACEPTTDTDATLQAPDQRRAARPSVADWRAGATAFAGAAGVIQVDDAGSLAGAGGSTEVWAIESSLMLRAAAEKSGRWIGAALETYHFDDPSYSAISATEFNYLTPESEMKRSVTDPAPNEFTFVGGDALVAFAEEHQMPAKGHCLVWHSQRTGWINELETTDDVRLAMARHIEQVAGHFRGRIAAWDVVDKAIDDGNDNTAVRTNCLGVFHGTTLIRVTLLTQETIELIERMSKENRLWGAERFRGKLLKLGIHVSKRTIQKYMLRAGGRGPHDGQTWKNFPKNHSTWACNVLQLCDVWFRPIFAFFVVDVKTKRVVHVGVNRAPSEEWTAQQLREVTPFDAEPQLLIRDGDTKYGAAFDRVAEGADIEVVKVAPCAPRMNAVCERFLGRIRREYLDHVVILGEGHLRSVLRRNTEQYFNTGRPHQGIGQRIPSGRRVALSDTAGKIVAFPGSDWLHHHYRRVA